MSHAAVVHSDLDLHSQWTAGRKPLVVLLLAAAVGATAAILHALMAEDGYRRFMMAYLVAFAFVLSLSLGGLFFVIIQHMSRAGWSVLVRRVAEALAANLLIAAVLFLPIAVSVLRGHGEIYPWAVSSSVDQGHDGHGEGSHASPPVDHHVLAKRPYLNPPFFIGRWAVLLATWAGFSVYFWRGSIQQDTSGDHRLTLRMEKLANPAALICGLTITLGAFDLLMSINPRWYSTIFGVYYFSGAAVGGLAAIILLVFGLQRSGMLTRAIGQPHYLDLGRLLFAFLFFWAYIAFSQYMLLWYANIPETTGWLRVRGMTSVSADVNAWTCIAIILLLGHFLIPFAGLMSRHVKGRPGLLATGAVWMLVMHYLDLAWIVMPEMGSSLRLGVIEWGLLLAVGSIYTIGLLQRLRQHSLVPLKDPRVNESAIHETVY